MRLDQVNEDGEVDPSKTKQVYEAIDDIKKLRERVENLLVRYNEENIQAKMELVLFDDALRHLLRISRIIKM